MNVNESLVGRRTCLRGLAGLLVGTAATAWAASETSVLLGTLQFGTVQWVADVILRNHLDAQHGFVLQTLKLANTEAGRIALMASSADIIVSDWTMAATQRAAGDKLCFAPFSSAVGGVMIPQDSAADTLRNLTGRTLGVAGGPLEQVLAHRPLGGKSARRRPRICVPDRLRSFALACGEVAAGRA